MSEAPPGTEPEERTLHPRPGSQKPPPESPVEHETRTGTVVLLMLAAGLLALLLNGSWAVVLVIFGVMVMVTVHELGHYLTAKWSGMKVTEFFFGFGPKLWSFQRGETEYGLKALPLGAYVRIVGMNNLDEVPPEDEPRTYRQQSFPKRLLVVLAGPATHFVQAWVILFLLFAVVGVPGTSGLNDADPDSWIVGDVTDDSAAARADLEEGDRVVAWDGEPVGDFADLQDAIDSTEVGDEVALTVERDGETFETTAAIRGRPESLSASDDEVGTPFLGVGPTYPEERLGVIESAGKGVTETAYVTKESVAALGRLFSPSGLSDFADTVSEGSGGSSEGSSGGSSAEDGGGDGNRLLSIYGAVRLGAALGEQGVAPLLEFFLLINIFVGLVNLVPLPPFDGGHAAVAIYERIRSRGGRRYHVDMTKLLPLAYAVVFGLGLLGVVTIYLDVVNPIEM
jgi:membrane-associated protease RseP (regulator of RpoE activity)